jgi:modulator of FtsH protease HflK
MIWQSQGGGPWGGGPRSGGPWGGGPRGGNGSGPGPRRPIPPDFEELLRRGQDRFRRVLPGGFGTGSGILIVVAAIFVIWLASGFYRVLPDQEGVVLRFGAYNRTTPPGLHYHLPVPIETVLKPAVTRVNRTEIGYRTEESGQSLSQVPEEGLMLTGDENIVDINFTVFWVIKDAGQYLFNIRDPEGTVKAVAESAMREVIGETPIVEALAAGRGKIENNTRNLMQTLLDSYGAGIAITQVQLQKADPPAQVIEAFRDVQRALADRETARNKAEAYRNQIIPKAKGEAVQIAQQAQAYKQQIIARATGDAARFDAVYQAYKAAEDVTRQRLYLETIEGIFEDSHKVIIDKAAEGRSGVLPYLPLPSLPGGAAPAPAAPAAASER